MEYYWRKIFDVLEIDKHDFDKGPFYFDAESINDISSRYFDEIEVSRRNDGYAKTKKRKEARLLCKFDSADSVPPILKKKGLFVLPIVNGSYALIKGNGYVEVPKITSEVIEYTNKLNFVPKSSSVGDSEMQHLDYAFATGLIKEFLEEDELHLLIRGRKYTVPFSFHVNDFLIESKSVQTEVDAGYESKEAIYLFEAKNGRTTNTIVRQLFYPYRYWSLATKKRVVPLFFEARKVKNKQNECSYEYHFWKYDFLNENDYSSIYLVDAKRYNIT